MMAATYRDEHYTYPEVYNHNEQAGLEVVKGAPEVAHVAQHVREKAPSYHAEFDAAAFDSAARKRRRRLRWIIGGVVVLVIVIAAVIGGVLGSRRTSSGESAGESSGAGSSTGTPGSSATPSATPTSIRPGSHLGVTGWRSGTNFKIWLFYQGTDSRIRVSRFDTSAGKWNDPSSVVTAKSDTPIGVSSFQQSSFANADGTDNQIELLYTDQNRGVREWNFLEFDADDTGNAGSMAPSSFGTGITRMTSYWPTHLFQDGSGRLIDLLFTNGVGWHYNEQSLPTNFSGLATVPNDPELAKWDIFSQRDGGLLTNSLGNETVVPAKFTQGPLSVDIPQSAAIGAFAVVRPSDNTQMNQYVLSQTDAGNFEMRWLEDSSGWQGPKGFSALNGADKGTNIVCLTPNAWPLSNLKPQFDMSRCYFQAGGLLREVQFDGKDWSILGNIPME